MTACFRPLIRGFFFYYGYKKLISYRFAGFPSPHSGILFLFGERYDVTILKNGKVSVPSFGDSFFISAEEKERKRLISVSVPSFGDSFFIRLASAAMYFSDEAGFRPLIRGFFFYLLISILYRLLSNGSFRPLIRGFFFYAAFMFDGNGGNPVSVPSFGDSFFIERCQKKS